MPSLPTLLADYPKVSGAVKAYEDGTPKQSQAVEKTLEYKLNIVYRTVSLALNLLLTGMILLRLLRARAQAISTLGAQYGTTYKGVAAVVVESALPYAVLNLVYIITYSIDTLAGLTLQNMLVQLEVCLLLLYHNATLTSWIRPSPPS
jgi:hypothetical protein